MCDEWVGGFERFLADMGECPPRMSIDRYPDRDGNYEKDNCRWATNGEQSRNRTDNVFVDYDGRRIILKDFAAEVGVNYKSLHGRMKRANETAEVAAAHLRARRP